MESIRLKKERWEKMCKKSNYRVANVEVEVEVQYEKEIKIDGRD